MLMLIYFCYMTLINIAGIILGKLFTESSRLALPKVWKYLDRKPFNCRPCFTFHFLWIIYALVAFKLNSVSFFIVGFIYSLSIFCVLYLNNKNKISN